MIHTFLCLLEINNVNCQRRIQIIVKKKIEKKKEKPWSAKFDEQLVVRLVVVERHLKDRVVREGGVIVRTAACRRALPLAHDLHIKNKENSTLRKYNFN